MFYLIETTSLKLSPSGKYCLCFQSDGESDHADQCDKSRALNKFVDSIIKIESFNQQCVIITGLLHSALLKHHMVTIRIYQSLSNNALYEY